MVSNDVFVVWMQQMKQYLHPWWDHPQYEDLLSCAWIAMWEAVRHVETASVRNLEGYVMRAGWWGARDFLMSPANDTRRQNRRKQEVVRPLSWEEVCGIRGGDWWPGWLVQPDFAPALIDRIAAQQRLEKLARFSPRKAACLILGCYCAMDRTSIARELGLTRETVYHLLRGVDGIPNGHPGKPENFRR